MDGHRGLVHPIPFRTRQLRKPPFPSVLHLRAGNWKSCPPFFSNSQILSNFLSNKNKSARKHSFGNSFVIFILIFVKKNFLYRTPQLTMWYKGNINIINKDRCRICSECFNFEKNNNDFELNVLKSSKESMNKWNCFSSLPCWMISTTVGWTRTTTLQTIASGSSTSKCKHRACLTIKRTRRPPRAPGT